MSNNIVLLICMTLLVSCTVPQFDATEDPGPPPVFGETVSGSATWYGPTFTGRITSSGELFDMKKLTASHASLPFGTVVEVTDPESGNSVKVVINDRHYLEGKYELCLSRRAAKRLGVYPKAKFAVTYMVIE